MKILRKNKYRKFNEVMEVLYEKVIEDFRTDITLPEIQGYLKKHKHLLSYLVGNLLGVVATKKQHVLTQSILHVICKEFTAQTLTEGIEYCEIILDKNNFEYLKSITIFEDISIGELYNNPKSKIPEIQR